MDLGAYGVKLLGSGGCGFLMVICNPTSKKKILKKFKNDVLEIEFENQGTSIVYPSDVHPTLAIGRRGTILKK